MTLKKLFELIYHNKREAEIGAYILEIFSDGEYKNINVCELIKNEQIIKTVNKIHLEFLEREIKIPGEFFKEKIKVLSRKGNITWFHSQNELLEFVKNTI